MLSCQSRISSWRKVTRRPSSVRAVMWTEYSGSGAPAVRLRQCARRPHGLAGSGPCAIPPCRRRAGLPGLSTVTTVPLKSCFSHCVAPMRMRSPTATSSGSVRRPSRSRLTSMTARFASGVCASTRSRMSHDSARPSAFVRASTTADVLGLRCARWRSQSSTSFVSVFSSSWQRCSRLRRCQASMAFSASPSLRASETATCHGVKRGFPSIAS